MKTCAVTGAEGFLGQALVQRLEGQGWKVYRLVRNPGARGGPRELQRRLVLGDEVPAPEFFREAGIRCLIHAAYDFGAVSPERIERVNVQGTRELFESAAAGGVFRILFISSISAFEGCKSLYGRAKLSAEQYRGAAELVVLRPGLIYDRVPEGLTGKMLGIIRKLPVVPLIGSGRQIQYACHRQDLAELVARLAEAGSAELPSSPVAAAHPQPLTFRGILAALATAAKRKPWFIPIPASLVWLGLRLLEAFGLSIGLRSDSVVSLDNQNPHPDFAPLQRLGVPFRPFSEKEIG